MTRTRVPTLDDCASTIMREVRYWSRAFRGLHARDDLQQEAMLVALRVLDTYDTQRGADVKTLLTLALRNHFRSLIRLTLRHMLRTDHSGIVTHARETSRAIVDPRTGLDAALLLRRLRALSRPQQVLAWALVNRGGNISQVSKDYGWSVAQTRKHVLRLRRALTEEGT